MADNSDLIESLRQLVHTELDTVNTAIDCTVISYSSGKVSVKPKGMKLYSDGDSNAYPVVSGLRMVWPQFSGGKAGVKGPVVKGDECLLIICQQAIDGSDDTRRFDIVDSYVIPGAGYSDAIPGNDNMVMYFGGASIALTPGGKLIITAPGGVEENAPTHKSNAEHDMPKATIGGIDFGTHKHKENGDGGGITDGPQ